MLKKISTRMVHKHDLEINWLKAVNFVPWQGELIIYDAEVDESGNTLTIETDGGTAYALPEGRATPYTYERLKIGDGKSNVNDLPFVIDSAATEQFLPTKDTLANMSWADIQTVCKAGKASEYWAIGDQKTIAVNGISYTVDLIGFDHDTPTDKSAYGRSKAGATFQLHDLLARTYPMNSDNTSAGGWKSSVMRTSTMATLFGQLSPDLKEVIVPVNKWSGTGGSSSSGTEATSDSLFLLAEIEIFGSTSYSVFGEGSQYAYYSNGNSALKYRSGDTGVWWERSPCSGDSRDFCRVGVVGGIPVNATANHSWADKNLGVSFGFCV